MLQRKEPGFRNEKKSAYRGSSFVPSTMASLQVLHWIPQPEILSTAFSMSMAPRSQSQFIPPAPSEACRASRKGLRLASCNRRQPRDGRFCSQRYTRRVAPSLGSGGVFEPLSGPSATQPRTSFLLARSIRKTRTWAARLKSAHNRLCNAPGFAQ